MKFIGRFIVHFLSNAVAIIVASYFVAGFSFSGDIMALAVAAVILTLINTFIRPVLKLLLGPLVILTFGLFTIIINALSLYLLDTLTTAITIQGYLPLLLATLIVSAVNAVIGLTTRWSAK